jgi:Holliday junction resolvase RusA-like endonuclease
MGIDSKEENDEGWYELDLTPQTSPRPRLGKFGAYMPAKYKAYQDCMIYEMKKHNILPQDFGILELIVYFPYPSSTPKKHLIDNFPMRKKPDYDNTAKAITDCLEKLGIIHNDSQIYKAFITKLYTTQNTGRIKFKLSI